MRRCQACCSGSLLKLVPGTVQSQSATSHYGKHAGPTTLGLMVQGLLNKASEGYLSFAHPIPAGRAGVCVKEFKHSAGRKLHPYAIQLGTIRPCVDFCIDVEGSLRVFAIISQVMDLR